MSERVLKFPTKYKPSRRRMPKPSEGTIGDIACRLNAERRDENRQSVKIISTIDNTTRLIAYDCLGVPRLEVTIAESVPMDAAREIRDWMLTAMQTWGYLVPVK